MTKHLVIVGVAAATAIGAVSASPPEANASPAHGVPVQASDQAPDQAAAEVDAPVPDIEWEACEDGLHCATVQVPLDYDDPGGETAELALAKHPAGDPDARLGTLFVNPGGPGDSAVQSVPWYVDNLPSDTRRRFDVVGIDPRGVGDSTPLRCRGRGQGDAAEAPSWAFPLTRAQERTWLRYDRYLQRSCRTDANPIIDHMTTADTARDMDLIRQAVGDEQLTYYGISYGSYLGATYAAMFPDRVRAVVVDGVIDPIGYATGHDEDDAKKPVTERWGSARGAWETLTSAFAECDRVGEKRCPIAGESTAKWHRIMNRLEEGPVDVDGTQLRYQDVVITVDGSLRAVTSYLPLMRFIDETHDAMFGSPREREEADAGAAFTRLQRHIADDPEPATSDESDDLMPVTQGIICADSGNPDSPRAWVDAADRAEREAPWFGRLWSWRSSVCSQWPGSSEDAYRGPFEAETSNPVLLVAHLHDPASPISGARVLNTLLEGSRMLTLDGWGHGALGESECVAAKVDDYLISGTLPPAGSVCEQDGEPFPG
ncbi:alpha/beta hydrolase [Actinobacteria bacterium YIM 96077]|uniref:Alpha/beta hydrolase n=1 Tax=Phytoactinopolyspora halophila TaxID=1981511 RepID=A0A329QM50_9ACTN|nr:alpha/beta hydrolase [Phytoactinopolyspora halophila]AYY12595.1 alpha/beta hydrolase [Actinobacteria bacterium YIM 96077]RAW12502.1 alpha/beta hydrolase [Phytoactinopolyspora halophila]